MVEHYLEVLAYTPSLKAGVFHMIPNMNLEIPALNKALLTVKKKKTLTGIGGELDLLY